MSLRSFLATMIFILALPLALLQVAAAEVVGHFSQVEGRVDLLKSGNLPAIPVKIQDGVEPGDVVRTKTLSKAQITFVDNSVMTISPESRVGIEAYMFDPAQNKCSLVSTGSASPWFAMNKPIAAISPCLIWQQP